MVQIKTRKFAFEIYLPLALQLRIWFEFYLNFILIHTMYQDKIWVKSKWNRDKIWTMATNMKKAYKVQTQQWLMAINKSKQQEIVLLKPLFPGLLLDWNVTKRPYIMDSSTKIQKSRPHQLETYKYVTKMWGLRFQWFLPKMKIQIVVCSHFGFNVC